MVQEVLEVSKLRLASALTTAVADPGLGEGGEGVYKYPKSFTP